MDITGHTSETRTNKLLVGLLLGTLLLFIPTVLPLSVVHVKFGVVVVSLLEFNDSKYIFLE